MPTILPLKSMSKIQKLRGMWVNLTPDEANFASPVWHLTEFQKPEAIVAAGKEELFDLEEAKKSLRRRFR